MAAMQNGTHTESNPAPNGHDHSDWSGYVRARRAHAYTAPVRKAPHNMELEQAFIGALLLNNEVMDRVSSFLEPHHFFESLHQKIFETAAKLIRAGKPATPVTLKTFFENAEPISPTLTVPQYLGTLAANATSIKNAEAYGRTIYDLATRRALVIIGEDMANSAYNSAVDAPPVTQLQNAVRRLDKLSRGEASGLTPITLEGLINMDLPKREWVLTNLLQQRGIAMVYAWRGAGKTWFALGLGSAIASGTAAPEATR